jgi:hypothetical protein
MKAPAASLRWFLIALALIPVACDPVPGPDSRMDPGTAGPDGSPATGPTTFWEELKEPALIWEQDPNGLCSKILAVDADGTVWTEQGCENGRPVLRPKGTAPEAKLQTLREKMAALPPASGQTPDRCEGLRHTFSKRTGGAESRSTACGSGRLYDDVTGLPEPYLAAAQAFLSVP